MYLTNASISALFRRIELFAALSGLFFAHNSLKINCFHHWDGLYLRARNYGIQGLEVSHPGFEEKLRRDPEQALSDTKAKDVRLIYWTAASWSLAITLSKDDPVLMADIPIIEALIDRALVLDESYGDGAIHSFLVAYEMIRPGGSDRAGERAHKHFQRALELSQGHQAGIYVTYAESVELPRQNRDGFESLLQQALAVDADLYSDHRLANLISQERARWLMEHSDDLFIE